MVSNTTKPLILTAVDGLGLRDLHEMACLICGGEDEFRVNPLFIVYIEPVSPLSHGREAVEKLLYAAEKRIPAMYTPCPSAGATAPATIVGMLVQDLAETLLGLVLSNLKKPGMPLVARHLMGCTSEHIPRTSIICLPRVSLWSRNNGRDSRLNGRQPFSHQSARAAKSW